MDVEFEIRSNVITYIGQAQMVNRKREEGEPRSGSIFPLVDQSVTGFSDGTFDIEVSDNYLEDIKILKEKYPFIRNIEIKKNIAVLRKEKPTN